MVGIAGFRFGTFPARWATVRNTPRGEREGTAMKSATTTSSILAALLVVLATRPGAAQDKKNGAQPSQSKERSNTASMPVYKPPLRGAPGGRVGGGTRGSGSVRDVFILSALAPDHMGLTVAEQPSLYWFI